MNQQCKVCGEPAAGFHFGAFTCEGCKSFFGRSYNNLTSISECKNQGACVINKKNRTSCKACRLRKCLLVGMSKSGSRYGRRSNWFKIHCLLQEQQQQQQQQGQQPQTSPVPGQKSPPPPLGMLGSHALHQHLLSQQQAALVRASAKEELLMLGLDEYKQCVAHSASPSGSHASLGSSLSGSSPESHNSDTSVEVGDAREGRDAHRDAHRLGRLPFRPVPVPHKEHLFLPFGPLASMLPHPAFLQPPCSLMLPPNYLPHHAAAARPFNNNNNETPLEYSKRALYGVAAPGVPGVHFHHRDEDDDVDDDESRTTTRVASPRPRAGPVPRDLGDHPMDLSVKGSTVPTERDDSGAEDADDAPRPRSRAVLADDASDGLSDAADEEDEEVDVELTRPPERTIRVIPLDLSART